MNGKYQIMKNIHLKVMHLYDTLSLIPKGCYLLKYKFDLLTKRKEKNMYFLYIEK